MLTKTYILAAMLAAALSITTLNGQTTRRPNYGSSYTVITPDGPVFVNQYPNGGATIIGHDGPSFVFPSHGGGATIFTPDGPILIPQH